MADEQQVNPGGQPQGEAGEQKAAVGLMERIGPALEEAKEKFKPDQEALKNPQKTQLYKSVFRVKHDDTPRSRSLSVISNEIGRAHV